MPEALELGWISGFISADPDEHDVHVWPIADEIEHNLDSPTECVCGVDVTEVRPGVFLYAHHASDGRT